MPLRGEADKAPTPTSLRPLSSSSWRARYVTSTFLCRHTRDIMRVCNDTSGAIVSAVFDLGKHLSSAPRACSLPSGLSLGMWCRATEGLGVYDQLTAG